MTQIDKDPKTFEIIGAAMEVHRALGSGFLEAVYQEALSIEFGLRGLPFKKEIELPVRYKEAVLSTSYRADFICYDDIIVELKAITQMSGKEESQVLNYLKATKLKIDLLLNFGSSQLEYKRFIL